MAKTDKRHQDKTIKPWLEKGWTALSVAEGAIKTDDIAFSHETQVLVIPRGQIFGKDGEKIKGEDLPRFKVEDTDTGAFVVFSKPLVDSVTLIYKFEELDAGEPEPESEAQ